MAVKDKRKKPLRAKLIKSIKIPKLMSANTRDTSGFKMSTEQFETPNVSESTETIEAPVGYEHGGFVHKGQGAVMKFKKTKFV